MTATHSQPKAPRRWRRRIGWGLAGLVLALVAAYFILLSEPVLRRVVLPRLAQAWQADISVEHIRVRPFSGIALRELSIRSRDGEPILSAEEVHASYRFSSVWRDLVVIEDVRLVRPVLRVVQEPDGTSNLDRILKPRRQPRDPSSPTPFFLDLRRAQLIDGECQLIRRQAEGESNIDTLSHLTLSLTNFAPGVKSTGQWEGAWSRAGEATSGQPARQWEILSRGHFEFNLDRDWQPTLMQGEAQVDITEANGDLARWRDGRARLQVSMNGERIDQLNLSFGPKGASPAEIRVEGTYHFKDQEGRLQITTRQMDHRLLNELVADGGWDFGESVLRSEQTVTVEAGGGSVAANGTWETDAFTMNQGGRALPNMRAQLRYEVRYQADPARLDILQLSLALDRENEQSVQAALVAPWSLALGETETSMEPVRCRLDWRNLELADWKDWIGTATESDQEPPDSGWLQGALTGGGEIVFGAGQFAVERGRTIWQLEDQPAGTVELSGDVSRGWRLAVREMDERALRPWLRSLLPEAQLASARLDGFASFQRDSDDAGRWGVQTDWRLTNLVVNLASGGASNITRNLALTVDGSVGGQSLDLRSARIDVQSTDHDPSHISLEGQVDWSEPAGLAGEMHLTTSPLDLTPYYRLWNGGTATATNRAGGTEPPSRQEARAPAARVDPEPRQWPVRDFQLTVSVPQITVEEVTVQNFLAQGQVEPSRVRVQPVSGLLNGRAFALAADLDTSVPGWRYAFEARADHLPLAHVIHSFSPGLAGKINGELVLDGRVAGSGITARRLRDELDAQVSMSVTNAEMNLVGTKGKARTQVLNRLLTLDAIVQGAAYLLRLPALMDSPIYWLDMNWDIRNGTLSLRQLSLMAQAFSAGCAAEIPLLVPLTNSVLPDVPLHFALERSVASGANLIPFGAPDDTPYVLLPNFIFVGGTLGDPKPELKKAALAGLVLKSTAGLPGAISSKAGQLLQGVGEVLTGERSVLGRANAPPDEPPPFVPGIRILHLPGNILKQSGNLIQKGSDILGGPEAQPSSPPEKKESAPDPQAAPPP